jgi:recombination protein RecA
MALKFYASVRMDIRKIENIKGPGDKIIGSRHRVKVVKNKVAPPFRVAEFDMDQHGISFAGGLLDVGIELNVIQKSGSFIKYEGNLLGQGREAAKETLIGDKALSQKIYDQILVEWRRQEGKQGAELVVGQEEKEEEVSMDDEV